MNIILNFKKILLLGCFIITAQIGNAQNDDKPVSITVSGSGKTLEDAKQAGLRSAIEQTFGVFISAKTEIFNDQVVADQIASVASGNIQSFQVLNESQLPDSTWAVTLKALVSVSKLASFVQAKGVAIEIKGDIFAANIKQQILNEQGEINAVYEMVGLLHEPLQISFDYAIKSSEPKSLDAENKKWAIPLVVTATANKNIDFCANYCIKTLAALSLTDKEIANYTSLNKKTFKVSIYYNGKYNFFNLRTQNSLNILDKLMIKHYSKGAKNVANYLEYYARLFKVQSGSYETVGKGEMNLMVTLDEYEYHDNHSVNFYGNDIIFLSSGQQFATFSWNDTLTLQQIEQLTDYSVKPYGVYSQFKHGGIVVYEQNGHGLVVSMAILSSMTWDWAKKCCEGFVLNGYNDWHLPTADQLDIIRLNFYNRGIGIFEKSPIKIYKTIGDSYWSSSEDYDVNHIKGNIAIEFYDGKRIVLYDQFQLTNCNVCFVRSF